MKHLEHDGASSTSSSLLRRVRAHEPEAWRRLAALYGPIVYGWARAAGFSEHDAADLVQDVYQAVFTSLHNFRRDQPNDRFRGWLWTITRRRACDLLRKRVASPVAAGGDAAQAMLQSLPEHLPEAVGNRHAEVVRRALELVKPEFAQHTWQACMQTAVEGRRPADVAADLAMSVGAVYVARSRVLKRLRQELDGLL